MREGKRMSRHLKHLLAVIWLASVAMPALPADHGRGHGPGWHGDIRRFHEHDLERWRGGHWYHGRHASRLGWWWLVGPAWYFYPAPVAPYPDPYLPPLDALPPAGEFVLPQYWYYCANPPGYYPYVAQCRGGWKKVPATPP